MSKRLSTTDTLSFGFMLFAFFLGAGNIIFPPLAGLQSGENLMPAMMGFLITAVGLPLICLVAIAKIGGGIPSMTKGLPTWVGTAIAATIFVVIGPAFATPRTGLVAYEIGAVPFLQDPSSSTQVIFTIAFFAIATLLALYPGKLMDIVGKALTPTLILLLTALAVSVLVAPSVPAGEATGAWAEDAFTTGFLEGYMTMDALGALIFGTLLVDILRRKGVTDSGDQARYMMIAGVIAAIGLAFVYISLFYVGGASAEIAATADNGGAILSAYVQSMFGGFGAVILAAVVVLACLTTAVGLTTAFAEYFNSKIKLGYRNWVLICAAVCLVVANLTLSELIAISIPVLFVVYPIAMALVIYVFARPAIAARTTTLAAMLIGALVTGVASGLNVAGLAQPLVAQFSILPLFDQHMGWIVPVIAALTFGLVYKRNERALATAEEQA
ncbi:branched-chain amino acid:cation transporter, LIVCS family [Ferrimonas marina]|uniref:Branched-chain amino acid transport system carrier protein n=1 Tax=Ferrimonas marina TaxID=299255 RepID=A0A1M5VU11_9GAMM|nr:branched-chain amino acid:cation transporter, LIVCS family [Ferrimonas marina]